MAKKNLWVFLAVFAAVIVGVGISLHADEFTDADVEHWQNEYMSVVKEGRNLWGSPDLGTNGVACGQCHPNAANTHPETYPKFQQQLGRVIALRDMINWCIDNPVRGERLEPDDPRMRAMEAYIMAQRSGTEMNYGKH